LGQFIWGRLNSELCKLRDIPLTWSQNEVFNVEMPSFDEMVRLAKTDPEALERIRLQLIEDTIADAPEACHRRLRGLQFQIDMERRRAGNPMGACVRISKMMHDSLYTLRQTLNSAIGEPVDAALETFEPAKPATIVAFPMQANS
jgi:hypothetical protein